MNKRCFTCGLGLVALLLLVGCVHAPDQPAQSETIPEPSAPLAPSVRVAGVWLKKPGYYAVDSTGTIGLKQLMEKSGGFVPFDKKDKFPSCFYIIRSIDDLWEKGPSAPIRYSFDGRKAVFSDGSIDVSQLPDIRIPPGYMVWFDWVLI
jgi:hypothetical protein